MADRLQYRPYLWLSAAAVLAAAFLTRFPDIPFEKYFGALNPVLATAIAAMAGTAGLTFLVFRRGFAVYRSATWRQGLVRAAAVATLLGIVIVAFDLMVVFPADINVALPLGLLFYPLMGFVVESLFHLLPLALVMLPVRRAAEGAREHWVFWSGLATVALLEPAFQVGAVPAGFPGWAAGFLALHLFVFNGLQLWTFVRYDFFTMFAFRMVYYLYWHILWGTLRLHVLF